MSQKPKLPATWKSLDIYACGNPQFGRSIGNGDGAECNPVTLDEVAAKRIFDEADIPLEKSHTVNFAALATKLNQAAAHFRVMHFLKRNTKRIKDQEKVADEISNLTKKLVDVLARVTAGFRHDFESVPAVIANEAQYGRPTTVHELIGMLERLSHVAQASKQDVTNLRRFEIDTSAAQYLAGNAIHKIYEGFLGRTVGISRKRAIVNGVDVTLRPSGPYVRFVLAAFRELGIVQSNGLPYGPDIVPFAVGEVRRGSVTAATGEKIGNGKKISRKKNRLP